MYLRYGDLAWDSAEAPPVARSVPVSVSVGAKPLAELPAIELLGVKLHAITEAGCIQHILDSLDAGRGGLVVTPNLDHLRRCTRDLRFSALVSEADLVVADGMPLIWASRLQCTPLPERVAGSDLISSLSAAAAEHGRAVFLLGGAPGTAEGAAKVLKERHPNLRIAGTHCPPVGFETNDEAMSQIVGELVHANPDIVYVALGSPKQELLVEQVGRHLPCAWWLGVGNSFSFLCGHVPRAPRWMQKCGLEWVHRLLHEPKRLFKRYIVLGVPFAGRMLGQSLAKGLPHRGLALLRRAGLAGAAPAAADEAIEPAVEPVARTESRLAGGNGQARASASLPPTIEPVADAAPAAASRLGRLRALVLLGGSVRPTALSTAIARSVLDLPLDDSGTILTHWVQHAAQVATLAGLDRLPVRVLVNPGATGPVSGDGLLQVERDTSELRGTGGVLYDMARGYADDEMILVTNAAQVMLEGLPDIAAALEKAGGDVSLIAHQDGTPSGVMLVRCAALRCIAAQGFVDMKEQALPLIARRFDVRVVNRRRPTAIPIRLLGDYILALRLHHRRRAGRPLASDPLGEDWRPTFSLVEPGATVEPGARVHDAVVLRGATVEAGAVVVRSLVCGAGAVRRDRWAVDQLVATGAAVRSRREARA